MNGDWGELRRIEETDEEEEVVMVLFMLDR